jgi:hypothetical protein
MGAGTALGSARNVPMARTVASWAAKPRRVTSPVRRDVGLAQVAPAPPARSTAPPLPVSR